MLTHRTQASYAHRLGKGSLKNASDRSQTFAAYRDQSKLSSTLSLWFLGNQIRSL